jgi:hypothetical protein
MRGISDDDIRPLVNPCRCASDWFADDLLMQWCPEDEAAEIREHAEYAIRLAAAAEEDEEIRLGCGLVLAQAVKYLGMKLHAVPAVYLPVVVILLGVDPGGPTVAVKRFLINGVAALVTRLRVHLINEDGMDVWRIE